MTVPLAVTVRQDLTWAGGPAGRPVIMIVVHGALAASTILLVVLAAAGAG